MKFKKCHGSVLNSPPPPKFTFPQNLRADERIRTLQQGLGRPIVAAKMQDQQIVAVGNTVYWSNKWKTFSDFLADFIKRKLDPTWGNAEIAKPMAERHPLMQWYHELCMQQQASIKAPGVVASAPMTGVIACYLGTAYALYLLEHNVELQKRFIARLKNVGQFQGAYYELIVASTLIRAGFKLTLEDEADGDTKHCEFKAVSGKTGKVYWVEAKMRAVAGTLGRATTDGGSDGKPLARLVPHLNKALEKPASDDRLIFIDVNTPTVVTDGKPDWLEPAMKRLEKFEREELKQGEKAYVFVTNVAHHRDLESAPSMAASPFGLGMPDFNRPGIIRLIDAYKTKQKHIDAHDIGYSLERYLRFPVTFDGSLPSEAFGNVGARVKIGQKYMFPDPSGTGEISGLVTAATASEQDKEAMIGVTLDNQQSMLFKAPMTDMEMDEWKEYGNAFFAGETNDNKHAKDEFDMFEWLMEVNKTLPRKKMLEWFGPHRDKAELEKMSDEDLLLLYCEGCIAFMQQSNKPSAA
jgi:hypothetical protein